MFVDFTDPVPPPRWEPKPDPSPARLTRRQRKVVEAIVGFNAVMLLCAPLAGATVIEGFVALFR